jgi:GDP-L-fucose synthase
MNILITGGNGFLGNELRAIQNHNLFIINRQMLDLTKYDEVSKFIEDNRIEAILHCAIKGGRRIKEDSAIDYYDNIIMFENLVSHINKLKIFINYDSAASYNRKHTIDGVTEKEFGKYIPSDFYGSSKYTVAKRAIQTEKCYNLRIFNCFGLNETPERMIKANILRYINKEPMIIHTNKIMDFFYIDDLVKITQFYLDNLQFNLAKDLNLCYSNKASLYDVAVIINNLDNHKVDIEVQNNITDFNYYGNSEFIDSLPINLSGLQYGITYMFNNLKGV